MTEKVDRKAMMRASLNKEAASVQDRFAKADVIMEQGGLIGKGAEAKEPAAAPPAPPEASPAQQSTPTPSTIAKAPVTAVTPAATPKPRTPAATFSAESEWPRRGIKVAIDLVDDNPYNARHFYDPDVVKERAASLATHGQRVAAAAANHPQKPGRYVLIDGQYRKRGLIEAGKSEIVLDIYNAPTMLDLYRLSFQLNNERIGQTPFDNALAWSNLLKNNVITKEEDLVAATGMSWPNINKTLQLLKLPAAALARIGEHPSKFGISIGYELVLLAKKADEKTLLQIIERIIEEDISSREVLTIRERMETGSTRKLKETSRQYKIHDGAGAVNGFVKAWDSGRIAFEITLIDADEREKLLTELKQRFHLKD